MFRKLKKRVETGALVTALVIPLALCVFAFLSIAGYFTFRESLPPNLAALVTAACGVVLIALILLVAKIANGSGQSSPSIGSGSGGGRDFNVSEDVEAILRDHADPVLRDWIRHNPDRAAAATLALGIAAGYSGQFRRILLDLYGRYAESEQMRRRGGD